MILSLAAALDLAQRCAPAVAPATILAIAHAESSLDTLAIHVNDGPRLSPASSPREAAMTARRYIAAGYSVDLGLGQINSSNLHWLGLAIEDSFDPCRNIAAAARVIGDNYQAAIRSGATGQDAMGVALSLYNTGKPRRGFANGYVARVYHSARIVSHVTGSDRAPSPDQNTAIVATVAADPVRAIAPPAPQPAAWNVFGRPASSALIFSQTGDNRE